VDIRTRPRFRCVQVLPMAHSTIGETSNPGLAIGWAASYARRTSRRDIWRVRPLHVMSGRELA